MSKIYILLNGENIIIIYVSTLSFENPQNAVNFLIN